MSDRGCLNLSCVVNIMKDFFFSFSSIIGNIMRALDSSEWILVILVQFTTSSISIVIDNAKKKKDKFWSSPTRGPTSLQHSCGATFINFETEQIQMVNGKYAY